MYDIYPWVELWHTGAQEGSCCCENRSVVSDSLQPHGLYSHRVLQDRIAGAISLLQGIFLTQVSHIAGDSLPAEPQRQPKNTGVDRLSLLQRIFLTQDSNWGFLHCR